VLTFGLQPPLGSASVTVIVVLLTVNPGLSLAVNRVAVLLRYVGLDTDALAQEEAGTLCSGQVEALWVSTDEKSVSLGAGLTAGVASRGLRPVRLNGWWGAPLQVALRCQRPVPVGPVALRIA